MLPWRLYMLMSRCDVQFPVYFHLFGAKIHPHPVMEGLGYLTAIGLHFGIKARVKGLGSRLRVERSLWEIAGALVGALVGAKLLAIADSWDAWRAAAVA